MKKWFFDRFCGEQFVALLERGKLTEFAVEKEPNGEVVGNVYKGRVVNVLPGMQAAFVDCGLERNCYLSTDENYTDYTKYDGTLSETNDCLCLKEGDEIVVQVTQPPRGNKGAKVTTRLSFVGKHIIYLPNTAFFGISRRITNENVRAELLKTAEKLRSTAREGFILRTQAPLVTKRQLKKEADYLKKLYRETTEKKEANARVGDLLYRDFDLPGRMLRDSVGDDMTAVYVGDRELYGRILEMAKLREDLPERKIHFYDGERSMLHEYGVAEQIYDALKPVVPLPEGGYIVIEHAEAMTVVDVNTGSYVGEKNRENTVLKVNLAAAEEIARQVRLRNVGGIVSVDFIDMADEAHKEAVTEALKDHLDCDRAKCRVLPMNDLCVTMFTRKRLGSMLQRYLIKSCSHCGGMGYVHEDLIVIASLRAKLLDCFANGYEAAIVELNENIMKKILHEGMFSRECKGRWKDKRVYMIPHNTFKEEQYTVRGDNAKALTLPDNAQILY